MQNKLNSEIITDVWLDNVNVMPSPHHDSRECGNDSHLIELLVIHNISLPPAQDESDFNNQYVEDFFLGQLDNEAHPYFKEIAELRVSAHLYIKRTGEVIQFVPLNKRAWHAGVSQFQGREKCNDFSIGIEMQGTDVLPYTELQYQALAEITKQIQTHFPAVIKENIVGHQEIAPGRKTDPGPSFDWSYYKSLI